MNVNKWGPGGWEFLHSITFNYPLEDEVNSTHQENYRNFFKSIGKIHKRNDLVIRMSFNSKLKITFPYFVVYFFFYLLCRNMIVKI